MKVPNKKLQNGFSMPVIGLGTWMMGGGFEKDPNNDDQADIKAVKNAIESGITLIDTAEIYAQGHSEELVGEAIKGYDRTKLFLVTKVHHKNFHYQDLLNSLDNSLNRLKTDYLDMYLLHGATVDVPIEEVMKAMDEAVSKKLVKNIGVCNHLPKTFEKVQKSTKNKLVVNQVHYNLIFREPEKKEVLKQCQENNIFLMAWRPVQKGILSKGGIKIIDQMSQKYGKTPVQIAINWLISQNNVITISKMRNQKNLQENLGALDWILEKQDIEKLRNEFPGQRDLSDAVPLR